MITVFFCQALSGSEEFNDVFELPDINTRLLKALEILLYRFVA